MSFKFLGPDPVEAQLEEVLAKLASGEPPKLIEVAQVDVKEEPGRRGPGGSIVPGGAENELAARYLAGEMACIANTSGGGAIILGVADDGTRIGTELEPEWLRHRIYELTEHKLTATVRIVGLDGDRLLVLTTPEAIEPIRHDGKLKWRVDDNCVEVDATTWHAGRLQRIGVDWSAQPSGHTLADVNPIAVEVARRYLRATGDNGAADLAAATDEDLLRRLHLVDSDGRLTNAGSLLFVGTPEVGIDYVQRPVHGADSTNRISTNLPLIEQIANVENASGAANRMVHLPEGFAHRQVRAIPERALREAIVNGVVHRDWHSPQPTTVEHVGDVLTVTSPGGFIGGVAPTNIITHPAVPRYRSLAQATADLRLAEREGIGVDRMVHDMLALGLAEPVISEIEGPYVRVALLGGDPDSHVVDLLNAIEPRQVASDVDALLIIDHLTRRGWIDPASASPVLQRPLVEAEAALERLARARIGEGALITSVRGVPGDQPPAWCMSEPARAKLAERMKALATPARRTASIMEWALARGRVSSTEAADIVGVSQAYAGTLLTELESEGKLVGSRETKLGRGFHYVPVQTTD